MKYVAALILLLPFCAFAYDPDEWICSSSGDYCIGVEAPKEPRVIWMNHASGIIPCPENVWCTLDLSEHVPPETVAVVLSGTLLIAYGFADELCDIRVSFRMPGQSVDRRMWQTIAQPPIVGSRTNASAHVPVFDQTIEYKWWRSTPGIHPDHCNYGINASLQAFIR